MANQYLSVGTAWRSPESNSLLNVGDVVKAELRHFELHCRVGTFNDPSVSDSTARYFSPRMVASHLGRMKLSGMTLVMVFPFRQRDSARLRRRQEELATRLRGRAN